MNNRTNRQLVRNLFRALRRAIPAMRDADRAYRALTGDTLGLDPQSKRPRPKAGRRMGAPAES